MADQPSQQLESHDLVRIYISDIHRLYLAIARPSFGRNE
jgi:hypothetical protein